MSKDTRRMFGVGMEFDNVRIRYAQLADYLAEIMPDETNGAVFNNLRVSCRFAIEYLSQNPPVMADEDGEVSNPDFELDEDAEPAEEVPTENPGL